MGADHRVFDAEGVRFALEVHPTEIAYDFVTTRKALDGLNWREGFGINLDPSHFVPQFLDPAAFALEFATRIITCTPRTRCARWTAGGILGRTWTLARTGVAGRSCRPDTATSTSKRCCGR